MKVLKNIIAFITCIFLVVMVLGALWQVFSRYVLHNPSQFTDELLRFMLIWTGLLGACYAFITEKHLSLIFLRNKLNHNLQNIVIIFSYIMTLLFSILILIMGGLKLSMGTLEQLSPILKLPMGLIYSIIPISGILIAFIQVLSIFKKIKEMKGR
ncbi:C4-dicarboxylate transport system permease small protein [Brachyspira pilosicoli B2904]|uniref:C4-dicarboxylate transport system permease small protein n=1 Tax=Brachyspira pilosicoli B2904 TaxID=1133568 RepID=J9UDQ2_BRAPL|nr:TRAP transporter small permease [Brachyspira pilosicoli]AFR70246.1 C4-dicarboxylate transport system permease small protein [Brachyspira pilosicoli B2904]